MPAAAGGTPRFILLALLAAALVTLQAFRLSLEAGRFQAEAMGPGAWAFLDAPGIRRHVKTVAGLYENRRAGIEE